jgi:DNA-binding PadR family transcriptional regulator
MTIPARPRSPLWLVVLSLACEEPMHPYRMQVLIKQRGKGDIANVAQRNSVYQTIEALRRTGLIEARETVQTQRRPERTIYTATAEGRRVLKMWITTALSTPAKEFPEFPAALATLDASFTPNELANLLETRVTAIELRRKELERPFPEIPRIFLIESEYMASVARAELRWLRSIIDDLRSGRLRYPSLEEMRRLSVIGGPSEQALNQMHPDTTNPNAVTRTQQRRRKRHNA